MQCKLSNTTLCNPQLPGEFLNNKTLRRRIHSHFKGFSKVSLDNADTLISRDKDVEVKTDKDVDTIEYFLNRNPGSRK
jgi:hypothetical protein